MQSKLIKFSDHRLCRAKALFRVKEKLRSGELAVSGDQWPLFLYQGYNYDPEDPWNGLFKSTLLIFVSDLIPISFLFYLCLELRQAYKHIFTSPSSVEKDPKATRSGNARIHGMYKVTLASIAYVATQVGNCVLIQCSDLPMFGFDKVRFSLSSSPVFSRTDTTTDSERFYNSVVELFGDPEETEEVNELLTWWNR